MAAVMEVGFTFTLCWPENFIIMASCSSSFYTVFSLAAFQIYVNKLVAHSFTELDSPKDDCL